MLGEPYLTLVRVAKRKNKEQVVPKLYRHTHFEYYLQTVILIHNYIVDLKYYLRNLLNFLFKINFRNGFSFEVYAQRFYQFKDACFGRKQ